MLAAERTVTLVRGREVDEPAVDRLEVELEGSTNRSGAGPSTGQALLMIGDLEPSQGNLGVLPSAMNEARYPPAPASNRVACDLDIYTPDALPHRLHSARSALPPVLRRPHQI